MVAMAKGWFSPWQASWSDYQDRKVTAQIPFNETTLAIVNPGLTGHREVGCLYDEVEITRPDGAIRVFPIPEGDFQVNRQQLSAQGFTTINQIVEAGITLGTSGQ